MYIYAADLNGDGRMERTEFRRYVEISFDVLIKKADADGSGRLSKVELEDRYGKTQTADILQELDINGDESVERQEFFSVHEREFLARDRNRDGIYSMRDIGLKDENGDGDVDLREYRKAVLGLLDRFDDGPPAARGYGYGCPANSQHKVIH